MNKFYSLRFFFAYLILLTVGCKSAAYIAQQDAYGEKKGDKCFSIAVLPDTQYYTAHRFGGTMEMFDNQINWIIGHQQSQNIAYVIHLGDVTDHNTMDEWENAKKEMYKLEDHHIPYGVSIGNHDEKGNMDYGTDTTKYVNYFGSDHFRSKPWYGGTMGNTVNNDNHFDLFSANGEQFLVLYFSYNEPNNSNKYYYPEYEKAMLQWADSVLTHYADRHAILVTHSMLRRTKDGVSQARPNYKNTQMNDGAVAPDFTQQGSLIYDMAKHHANVFLMLGGHISGEGFRKDVYKGNTIKTYLTDYQARQAPPYGGAKDRNGGGGLLRLMKFNQTQKTLSVVTFAPQRDGTVLAETDGDSQFTQPLYQ